MHTHTYTHRGTTHTYHTSVSTHTCTCREYYTNIPETKYEQLEYFHRYTIYAYTSQILLAMPHINLRPKIFYLQQKSNSTKQLGSNNNKNLLYQMI